MKTTKIKLFAASILISIPICAEEFDVTIERYNHNFNLPSLNDLPSGTCVGEGAKSTCNFGADTKIKWGAGWCQNSAEDIERLIAKVDVKLYVNGKQIKNESISKQHEFYPRPKLQYCYTWLVQLSNWKPGATVFLVSKDAEEIQYEATINVEKNGT